LVVFLKVMLYFSTIQILFFYLLLNQIHNAVRTLRQILLLLLGTLSVALLLVLATYYSDPDPAPPAQVATLSPSDTLFRQLWTAPADWRLQRLSANERSLVVYGRELIAQTAQYLGPRGSVRQMSNGMNCQNCHLQAGTQPWGNNYFGVEANYPKFRARSGGVESKVKRINDCFERSLNGQALDSNSREMQAMLAYLRWVGSDVPPKIVPRGSGIFKLAYLKRAADPDKGQKVYLNKCQSCHQAQGEGVLAADGTGYVYPPLWGPHSYNIGAGLYRISFLAGYVKMNMPGGTTYQNPQLSDEECWDVAAYINSQPRPAKDLSRDWPKIASKPVDHPFGPFADPFSEKQHKYGPFKPIKEWKEKNQPGK
jgi:thiosulfate dehydrogenase